MTMKKLLVLVISLIAIAAALFLWRGGQARRLQAPFGSGDKTPASASFYPLYFFASEIGGDKALVTNITPAGVEPHDFDPTAQEVARLQQNKLLILNGAGFEPWADKLKDELTGILVVDTSEGIDLDGRAGKEGEGESELDPHVWLSPVLAKSQAEKIFRAFSAVDPGNKTAYEQNHTKLAARFDDLDKNYKEGLRSCKQNTFVTSHSAFGYLAREYNLKQASISGLSPEAEPSFSQLAQTIQFVKDNNVKYIFFETLVSPKLAQTIANETGAQTLVLDPLEGLSDDDIGQGKNYFTTMEENLKNLQLALECSK